MRGLQLIYQTGQDDFPVIQDGHLVGIVTRPALVEAMNIHGADMSVASLINTNVPVVSPRDKVTRVFEEIVNGNNVSAVVIDGGQIVGILSPDNISRYLLVQSSIKSVNRRGARPSPKTATPPLAPLHTPAPPPVIASVPPVAIPPPRAESGPSSGLA